MKKPKRIAHIGIAVTSIQEALPLYIEHLGIPLEKIETIQSERVKIAFLKVGESRIELLEPLDDTSTISTFLQKRGEGIHHIALEVDQIEKRIQTLQQNGIKLIHDLPIMGADNSKIAFLHPHATHGVLVELCESEKDK